MYLHDECARTVHKVPWHDGNSNQADQTAAAPDIDVSRKQRCQVHSRTDAVEHYTQSDLACQKPQAGKEGASTGSGIKRISLLDVQEQQERVPEYLPIQLACGTADQDTKECGQADRDWCREHLSEQC